MKWQTGRRASRTRRGIVRLDRDPILLFFHTAQTLTEFDAAANCQAIG
jgi:hypothetical protein